MFKSSRIVLFLSSIVGILATSPPYDPEQALRQKEEYCKELLTLQGKLPEKYQVRYSHIQSALCPDKDVKIYGIVEYINANLSKDEQTEVHVIQNGKENYCNFVLGLSQLYRLDGKAAEDVPDKVTAPQYLELKKTCEDPSKDVSAIIPLAQELARIYYHF